MPRALVVEILGNSKQFAAELDRAAGKTRQFGKAAGVAGVALAAGLAYGLEKSVKAAMAGQVSQASLDTALRNTHQSLKAMAPALEAAEAASRKLGFADDDTRIALSKLETATGNTKKSIIDLGLAEDVARLKHTDLDTATKLVTGTLAGNTRAAKQLGLSIQAVTPNMDALRAKYAALGEAIPAAEAAQARFLDKQATGAATLQAVTDKVHGQAQAFADTAQGGMEQFHAQVQHIEESLGTLLLPAVKSVATGLADLTSVVSGNKTLFEAVAASIAALAAAFGIATVAQWAFDTAAAANPYVLIAAGVIAAVAALTVLELKFHFVEKAVGGLTDAFKAVKDWIEGNWPAVAGLIAGPFGPLVGLAKSAFGIAPALVSAFERVKNFTSDVVGAIVGFFEGMPGSLLGAASAAGHAVLAGFGSALAGFGAMLERLIKAPLNAIIGAWNSTALDFTLPSIDTHIPGVGKIGGQHVGFTVPQIPTLDTGGLVLGTGLALVHKGESVIPAGAGGAQPIVINIHAGAFVHERQVGDYITQVLQKRAASMPAGTAFRT
jgi:hypothetical protein